MRALLVLASLMVIMGLTSCAMDQSRDTFLLGVGPEYRIGPIEVIIGTKTDVQRLCRWRPSRPYEQIYGCYQKDRGGLGRHRIVTVEDPYVVLHEFKHYFEGRWHE